MFAFSVEAAEPGAGYRLRSTNRYAHANGYIRDLARTHGFSEISCDQAPLRKHKGTLVEGYIFVLQREK